MINCIQCDRPAKYSEAENPARTFCGYACQLLEAETFGGVKLPKDVLEAMMMRMTLPELVDFVYASEDAYKVLMDPARSILQDRFKTKNPREIANEFLHATDEQIIKFIIDPTKMLLGPSLRGEITYWIIIDSITLLKDPRILDVLLEKKILPTPIIEWMMSISWRSPFKRAFLKLKAHNKAKLIAILSGKKIGMYISYHIMVDMYNDEHLSLFVTILIEMMDAESLQNLFKYIKNGPMSAEPFKGVLWKTPGKVYSSLKLDIKRNLYLNFVKDMYEESISLQRFGYVVWNVFEDMIEYNFWFIHILQGSHDHDNVPGSFPFLKDFNIDALSTYVKRIDNESLFISILWRLASHGKLSSSRKKVLIQKLLESFPLSDLNWRLLKREVYRYGKKTDWKEYFAPFDTRSVFRKTMNYW